MIFSFEAAFSSVNLPAALNVLSDSTEDAGTHKYFNLFPVSVADRCQLSEKKSY